MCYLVISVKERRSLCFQEDSDYLRPDPLRHLLYAYGLSFYLEYQSNCRYLHELLIVIRNTVMVRIHKVAGVLLTYIWC